jgi:competence protein ComEA
VLWVTQGSVPGIGPATADKIIQARKSYGRFKSLNELQAIRGIGPKKLDKMRKYLTVGTVPQSKSTATQVAGPAKPPPAKNQMARRPRPQQVLRLPPVKRKSPKAIDFL